MVATEGRTVLLGTFGGAITATLIAAGGTPEEMRTAARDRSVLVDAPTVR